MEVQVRGSSIKQVRAIGSRLERQEGCAGSSAEGAHLYMTC
jgi:hypothetical protein